jgi:hypothetical protein
VLAREPLIAALTVFLLFCVLVFLPWIAVLASGSPVPPSRAARTSGSVSIAARPLTVSTRSFGRSRPLPAAFAILLRVLR